MFISQVLYINLKYSTEIDSITFSPSFITNIRKLSIGQICSDDVLLAIVANLTNLTALALNLSHSLRRCILHLIFLNLTSLTTLRIFCNGTISENLLENASVNIANLQNLKNVHFEGLTDCPEICFLHLSEISGLENVKYKLSKEVSIVFFLIHEIL